MTSRLVKIHAVVAPNFRVNVGNAVTQGPRSNIACLDFRRLLSPNPELE